MSITGVVSGLMVHLFLYQKMPLNCRATNQYINRYVVMYMANIFINPIIEHFFKEHNVNIDQDKYALAELIQFIYRTRIREDKEIYCYIPSKRLR